MQAIILVGGLGTRLREVVPDLPKPMAPIANKPFLAHLLQYLAQQGITRVVLSVGYLQEKVKTYFQANYQSIDLEYACEETPLGTGGAILNALPFVNPDEPIFVINGDTFVKLDYRAMLEQHQAQSAKLSIALRAVEDCSRYGKVLLKENRITGFKEKGEAGNGFINAGIYLLDTALLEKYRLPKVFSWEVDFLLPYAALLQPHAFVADDYFIDIGIPEDYARAQVEFMQF